MTTTPKLIIWDVDGTLSDSQGSITASMAAAFEAEGLAPPQRVDTGGHELVVAWDGDALAVWYRDPTGGVHDAGTIAL